jgi:hypothetical protein
MQYSFGNPMQRLLICNDYDAAIAHGHLLVAKEADDDHIDYFEHYA